MFVLFLIYFRQNKRKFSATSGITFSTSFQSLYTAGNLFLFQLYNFVKKPQISISFGITKNFLLKTFIALILWIFFHQCI